MDPEETLRRLRVLAENAINDAVADEDAVEMAELFQAMDGWLSKGGFLPAAWKHG